MSRGLALVCISMMSLAHAACAAAQDATAVGNLTATETLRIPAEEAKQGVVADARHLYAISNSEIGKYDRASRKRVARWQGDPAVFRHMNSCRLLRREIVCAASNYPELPQASSVEWFDIDKMQHVRSRSLGPGKGSLTWLDWHDGSWWACFANYDAPSGNGGPRGGEPGRDHRLTTLVRYSPDFVEQGAWLFPESVLERFAPYSSSGGVWGEDGLLYVTGHDRPEMYALRLPEAGARLALVATIALPTGGQAIAWDGRRRLLWSIDRKTRDMVQSDIPPVKYFASP